jgi:hypothetical protein
MEVVVATVMMTVGTGDETMIMEIGDVMLTVETGDVMMLTMETGDVMIAVAIDMMIDMTDVMVAIIDTSQTYL